MNMTKTKKKTIEIPAFTAEGRKPVVTGTVRSTDWCVYESPLVASGLKRYNGYVRVTNRLSDEDIKRYELDVHGGVTYCKDNWAGFDTDHVGDYSMMDEILGLYHAEGDKKWTLEDVIAETKNFARKTDEFKRIRRYYDSRNHMHDYLSWRKPFKHCGCKPSIEHHKNMYSIKCIRCGKTLELCAPNNCLYPYSDSPLKVVIRIWNMRAEDDFNTYSDLYTVSPFLEQVLLEAL